VNASVKRRSIRKAAIVRINCKKVNVKAKYFMWISVVCFWNYVREKLYSSLYQGTSLWAWAAQFVAREGQTYHSSNRQSSRSLCLWWATNNSNNNNSKFIKDGWKFIFQIMSLIRAPIIKKFSMAWPNILWRPVWKALMAPYLHMAKHLQVSKYRL